MTCDNARVTMFTYISLDLFSNIALSVLGIGTKHNVLYIFRTFYLFFPTVIFLGIRPLGQWNHAVLD